MQLEFNQELTEKEKQFLADEMEFGKIYKSEDDMYRTNDPESKYNGDALFWMMSGVELDCKSILPKVKTYKVYFENEVDNVKNEWKEKGLI